MRGLAVLFVVVLCASPVRAGQGFDMRFEVRLWGLPIGELTVSRRDDGAGTYAAESRFATTGVVGALAKVGFEMAAQGRVEARGLAPRRYSEVIDTGERAGDGSVRFAAGDGRLDPLTAVLIGLGARPLAEGCAIDREVFDGTRTHQLTLTEAGREAGAVTCAGVFRRTKGYTEAELRRRSGYTLKVRYRLIDGVLYAASAESTTSFGTVQVLRRAARAQ